MSGNKKQAGRRRSGLSSARLLCGASLTAVALLLPAAARAQADVYWDPNGATSGSGGAGNWNTSSPSWSQSNSDVLGPWQTWVQGDNAIFGTSSGTTVGTITLTEPITAHNITTQSVHNWVISGGTLTLAGTLGEPTPTITSHGNLTINSVIAGTAGFTKVGAGFLSLTGSNTFTGGVNITTGRLIVDDNAALGNAANIVNLANATRIDATGSLSGRTINLTGALGQVAGAGVGDAHFTGTGGISVLSGTMTDATNDFTGQATFFIHGSAGFTSVGNEGEASSLGAATGANATILFTAVNAFADNLIYSGDGDSSNRAWQFDGDGNSSGIVFSNSGTGTLTLTGDVAVNYATNFHAGTADFELLGTISGAGLTIFRGSGIGRSFTLSGANTYTSETLIGYVGAVTIKAPVLADTGANSSFGTGIGGGITILNGGVLSYTGAGSSSNRNWTIGSSAYTGVGHGTIQNDGTGALDLSGTVTFAPETTNSLTLGGSYAGLNTLSGVISGTGNLLSTGSGTWELSGTNTSTGTVTVNGGTLRRMNASGFGTVTGVTVDGGVLDLNGFDLTIPTLAGTGGEIALGAGKLTLNAATAKSYGGSITGTGGFTKLGAGILTLTGANTYTGATTIGGGGVTLDFSGAGGPTSNIIAAGSALNLAGGILQVTGAADEAISQSFNGTTISAGSNFVRATSGSGTGSLTLNLGAISRTGGLVDFVLPVSGNITTSNADGALGGWATIAGSDYAKVVGGNIVAFDAGDYTDQDDASLWIGGQIVSDDDGDGDSFFGTVGSSIMLSGLRYSTADAVPNPNTVTIAAGQTLGVDGTIIVAPSVGTSNQTIQGPGSLTGGPGGGTLGLQQNGGGTFTIAAGIANNGGATSFAKGGTGLAVLSGTNSYTGTTTVTDGTLSVSNIANGGVASNLGASGAASSNLVLEGGTLRYTGGDAVTDRGFTLVNGGPTRTIQVDGIAELEFTGQVTSADDAGFTKSGTGTLTLSNSANDYVGVTTVTGGFLEVDTLANGGVASTIGASSNASTNLVLNGGGLRYSGADVTTDRGFTLGTAHGRVDVEQAANTLTVSGTAVGAGRLYKDGAGTLALCGVNTYSGGTFVTAGTLSACSTSAFGTGGATIDPGATLNLSGFSNTVGGLNGSGSVTLGSGILTTSATGTFNGTITGAGGLTHTTGTQTISGCTNAYTGATRITGGTLSVGCLRNAGVASDIGASSNISGGLVIRDSGILLYTGGNQTTNRGFTLENSHGYVNVEQAGTTLEFTGIVAGPGNLFKRGVGTLVLTGNNTFTGQTRVEAGRLVAGSTGAFDQGTDGLLMSNVAGAVLDLQTYNASFLYLYGGGALGGNIEIDGGTLTVTNGSNQGYSGAISGTGSFVKSGGPGAVQALAGCNSSYTGTTTVSSGWLQVDCLTNGLQNSSIGASSSAASNLVLNGGTLRYVGAGGSTDRLFTLGGASALEASGTGAIVFSNTGAVAFVTPNAAQTVTLTGTNTGNNRLATLITNNGTGTTSLSKTGAGTWILSNSNSTYTGATSITGGVLGVDKLSDGGEASSIGASGSDATFLTIGATSTLRYTGTGDTTNRLFQLAAGSSTIESDGTGAVVFSNNGLMGLSGTGQRVVSLSGANAGDNIMGVTLRNQSATNFTSLAKNGAGKWILTGTNTYTGNTNVNQGTLVIGNGGTAGSIQSANSIVGAGAVLGFNRSDAVTFGGVVSGAGSVQQLGTGTTVLTGTNTYTGGTTISAGTLQLGSGVGGGATGSIVGNVTNSGTLAFNRNNAHTFAGAIAGTGTIAQIGTGTTTLTAANTAGATTIGAGTLQINGTLETATVAMTGTSALTVNGTMGAVAGGFAAFTGDAGASTININSGGTLRAVGDLGAGSDFVNVTGTLSTGGGTLSLGDGNDTLVLNGDWNFSGNVSGGSGNDTLQASGTSFRVLHGANVANFEVLNKTTAATLVLTGDHSYINGVTNAAGVLQIGDGTATGTLAGNVANSGTITFNRAGASTYTGVISGSGVLNHNGSGITTLTGNSIYTGATNVNGGTLLINGNQAGATGLTSVASGAALGGTGTIGGSVTVADGGTLAAGSGGVGALTINGNLTLANSSLLNFEFGAANVPGGPLNDLVNVGGNLTLDGVVNVSQTPGGTFGPGVYRMFNYSGALTNNGLTVGSVPVGTQAFVQTAVANQVNLVNTAGLTLSFWDGAAGPKNDGAIQGGDGTWHVGGGENNWSDENGVVNADYAQDSFAIFQGAAGTVTVDNAGGSVQASGMQFASDGYLIDGGPLTLTGTQALVRVGVDTIDPAYTATIDAELTGSAQLVKDLAGTLVLTGINSYTGGTAVNGGTLRIGADANLGDAAGGLSLDGGTLNTIATIASGRAVDLAGAGTFLTETGTALTLSGVVSGAGALTKDGAGSLVLTNANTYAGGTTIGAGTLQLGNGGTTGSITGDVTNDGILAFNRSDSLTFASAITGTGAVNQIGSGTTILTADNSYTGGTTISAGVLQLGAGGASGSLTGDIVNNAALVFNRSDAVAFAGLISGTGRIEQAGNGTTILTGANSYAGTTTVSSGALIVNGDQSAATGATSVASGATLGGIGIIGGDVTVAGGATLAPSDATGPGTLTINGNLALAGTSRLDYEFGEANMPGGPLNDLTQVGGDLTLDGTIDVTLSPGGSFGPGLYRVLSYGGTLNDQGLDLGSLPPGSLVSVQTSVSGQVNLVNSTGATLNFWDGADLANKADGAVNGGDGTWQNSSGNDNWTETTGAVNGPYTDASFAIFAAAPGTVDIDNSLGAVTASGLQFASDGYTITGQDLTLVGPQSTIRVGDGSIVGAGFAATIDAVLVGNSQLVKADLGTLVLSGANTYAGGTQIDAGALRISGDANLGDAAGALSLNGGTLNTTADIGSNRALNLLGTGTLLTDAGTSLTLNGVASGTGGFTKAGTGSLILTGANSFGGNVDVTAGSLFVNGDQSAATGAMSIASGATLGGSGIIGGDVTFADGAILAAGMNSVGTLTIGGNLALGAGAVLDFAFGSANVEGGAFNDLVNVGGDLALDGTISVSVPAGGSFGPGIYRVFNYGGALTDNGLALGTMPGGSVVSVQTAVAGQVNLVNTAGLTLSFWDGDFGPKNSGTVDGGNGVWRAAGGLNNWTDMNGAVNADYAQDSFAIFSAAPGTVTIDNVGGDVRASGMQFSSNGYTITGDALTLTGAQATVQVGDGSAASAGYSATIDVELAGSAALVKTDAGTLVLSGANTYTGGTAINGGTLRIAADANLGDAAGGLALGGGTLNTTADIISNRTVDLAGAGTFLTDGGTTLMLGGAVSGAGALTKDGTGSLVLTGANGYAGGTTIAAGTLQLGDGGTAGSIAGDVANEGVLAFSRSDSVTFAGAITGSGSLAQIGSGTTILAGNNTFIGGTTIAAGTLQLGDGGTTGGIIGDVVNDGALVFSRSDAVTFAGLISGTGAVGQHGAGMTLLTGANSYAGATSISAGTLLVNGDQSAATGATSVASGATLGGTGVIGGGVTVADGATLAAGAGGPGVLTINGGLTLSGGSLLAYDFGAANAVGNPLNDLVTVGGDLTLDGTLDVAVTPGGAFGIGLFRVINYGGTLTDNGLAIGAMPTGADVFVQTSVASQVNLINVGGATLNFWDGAAGPKFDGAINGGDGVWQNGSGNHNWADMTGQVNAGYDDGAFAIFTGSAGTVTIDNSLGAVTASGLQFAVDSYIVGGDALTLTGAQATIRVGDGTAAGAGYTATINAVLTGSAALVKTDAGTLMLSGTNTYTGGTAINGGTLRIASDVSLGAASGGLSFNGGTLNTTADMSSARAVDLAGTGAFLTDAGTTLTLTGAVSGAGGLTKSGTGTLALSGSGTLTGATSVGAGTLLVNGDYTGATGATTVGSGASLGGSGTIGGDVTLADGATLTPGAGGAGTLTVGGDLSLASGSQLAFEFGAANAAGGALNDLVNVGGDLLLDGTINVAVPIGGAFDAGVYRVFNYGGALTDNGLTLGALPAGSDIDVQTSIAGQVNLVNSAGLTLNFWDGAAGPKNDGVINGGDGTWQASGGNDNWADASGAVNAAYSDEAFAVFGGTAGTVTVDNSLGQVSATGLQFAIDGYTLMGGDITLTGPQSTIRVGDGTSAGAGMGATINSVLTGATQLVKTDTGTLVLGGANTYTGGTVINAGTLQIASDANLGATNAGVTLNGGTLAISANMTSARDIAMMGASTISTSDGATFTYTGQLSGTGTLINAGAGTLLVTGDNSAFTGTTRVEGTTIVNGSLCGDVDVAAGGRLGGTGSICTTVNAGTIAPGNSIGTLTVAGNYTGTGGTLEIEAELGGDASPSDRLVVTGNTFGSTGVTVINTGGLGAQTVEGIKIVDVGGTSEGTFTLNGDYVFEGDQAVIAGAYGYRLFQGGVTTPTDGDWYLRSALLDGSGQPTGPLYQPGVPIYESFAQTLQTLNGLPTLQQRVGNRQWSGFTQGGVGLWGRIEGARHRPEAVVSTSSTGLDTDTWGLQAGFDKALHDSAAGTLIAGVTGRYGNADARVHSPFGNGEIETDGFGLGATLTWYGSGGLYADAQAQLSWFDSDLASSVLGNLADGSKGSGEAFSLEVGHRLAIGQSLSVTPQAQIAYSNVHFDTFTDPHDAAVSSADADSLRGRLGFSLDHEYSWAQPGGGTAHNRVYGIVNLEYEMRDGTRVDVSGTPLLRREHRLWGELGAGISHTWNDGRFTVFTEVSLDTALADFARSNSLHGNAGFRMKF